MITKLTKTGEDAKIEKEKKPPPGAHTSVIAQSMQLEK